MSDLKFVLVNTPWWVYFIFIYCIWVGVLAHRTRVISYFRIFIVPILLVIWSLHSFQVRYTWSIPYLIAWMFALTIGSFQGWNAFKHTKIEADKDNLLIKIPGSWAPLVVILAIFFSRTYFGFIHSVHPWTLKNTHYLYPDIMITAFLLGSLLGRGLYYSYAYKNAPNTHLHRF